MSVILQLFHSYVPKTKIFLNHLLFLLHEVTLETILPQNTSIQVVELLESLIQAYNNVVEKISVISTPGFSEQEAGLVFETYRNLILANAALPICISVRLVGMLTVRACMHVISASVVLV